MEMACASVDVTVTEGLLARLSSRFVVAATARASSISRRKGFGSAISDFEHCETHVDTRPQREEARGAGLKGLRRAWRHSSSH